MILGLIIEYILTCSIPAANDHKAQTPQTGATGQWALAATIL